MAACKQPVDFKFLYDLKQTIKVHFCHALPPLHKCCSVKIDHKTFSWLIWLNVIIEACVNAAMQRVIAVSLGLMWVIATCDAWTSTVCCQWQLSCVLDTLCVSIWTNSVQCQSCTVATSIGLFVLTHFVWPYGPILHTVNPVQCQCQLGCVFDMLCVAIWTNIVQCQSCTVSTAAVFFDKLGFAACRQRLKP